MTKLSSVKVDPVVYLYGATPLYTVAMLRDVLRVFHDRQLPPAKYFLNRSEVTDESDLLENTFVKNEEYSFGSEIWLTRDVQPKYKCRISLGDSWIEVGFSFGTSSKHWGNIFELANDLAAVVHPDIGLCHLFLPQEKHWKSQLDKEVTHLNYVSFLNRDYKKEGPKGLATRTYLGPHYVLQFGHPLITSLNLPREMTDWGGVRIDLVNDPGEATVEELLAAWRIGMDHLKPAEVFASARESCQVDADFFTFTKGERCNIDWDVQRNPTEKDMQVAGLLAEVKRIRASGEFHTVTMDVLNFQNQDLSNLRLTNSTANGSNFGGASLFRSRLENCDFSNTNFVGATLSEMILVDCTLDRARFNSAKIANTSVQFSELNQSDFSDADLTHSKLGASNFSGSLFRRTDLSWAKSDGIFRDTRFEGARLTNGDFSNSDFESARLNGVHADNVVFRQANLRNAVLSGGSFRNADFQGANLENVEWEEADLQDAIFDKG